VTGAHALVGARRGTAPDPLTLYSQPFIACTLATASRIKVHIKFILSSTILTKIKALFCYSFSRISLLLCLFYCRCWPSPFGQTLSIGLLVGLTLTVDGAAKDHSGNYDSSSDLKNQQRSNGFHASGSACRFVSQEIFTNSMRLNKITHKQNYVK
jgi:hypothetical protein